MIVVSSVDVPGLNLEEHTDSQPRTTFNNGFGWFSDVWM